MIRRMLNRDVVASETVYGIILEHYPLYPFVSAVSKSVKSCVCTKRGKLGNLLLIYERKLLAWVAEDLTVKERIYSLRGWQRGTGNEMRNVNTAEFMPFCRPVTYLYEHE